MVGGNYIAWKKINLTEILMRGGKARVMTEFYKRIGLDAVVRLTRLAEDGVVNLRSHNSMKQWLSGRADCCMKGGLLL